MSNISKLKDNIKNSYGLIARIQQLPIYDQTCFSSACFTSLLGSFKASSDVLQFHL